MSTYKIKIVQGYRAMREIVIEVEADYEFEAIELIQSGSMDVPHFDDPRWKTGWDLQNEEYFGEGKVT